MATATKERRKAAAATRASKAKVEVAATVDVKALERDLFDAVKAKGVTVKTEVKTGKSGLETVHVKNDSGTKLGLVDRYDNRLRVWVRKGGEYERLTVNDDKSVTKAAAALASRSK